MTISKTILMVAAENDALPRAKVGGIGDVVRDLPIALAQHDCMVHVVVPSYGFLHKLDAAEHVVHYSVFFANSIEQVNVYRIAQSATRHSTGTDADERVVQWVIDHPALAPCGAGQVYCNDSDDRPFATDASKYALFCAAVGQGLLHAVFGKVDVLHLHDWHTALLAVLREYDPHYASLKPLHTVYSIHNLALQGVRPFKGDASSLQSWFAGLQYDVVRICDPSITHCFNPMRAAIELADKVHAVSPTYAQEVQQPSQHSRGIYGGEGLEANLLAAARQERLEGILNGCEYPLDARYTRLGKAALIETMQSALVEWASRSTQLLSAHWVANLRLQQWQARKDRGFVLTSVGRITEQKVRILKAVVPLNDKRQSVLQHILDALAECGTFILLGSGDPSYQSFFLEAAGSNSNFIYLQGYSDALSQALYKSGDLFLMASSFEPCGISQMLSMRAGQPCLVHGVGGLNDTVVDAVNGFVFRGDGEQEQGIGLLDRLQHVLTMDAKSLASVAKSAAAARFSWTTVAEEYLSKLY